MYGLVSLLEDKYYKKVEEIWQQLSTKHQLHGIAVTPFPHFSWQVAEEYDLSLLEDVMKDLSKKIKPFTVSTGGLGLFPGDSPVLFIAVVKSKQLLELHEMIYSATEQCASNAVPYYRSESWVPHISLAYDDLDQEKIGEVMKWLAFESFHWEIQTYNLSF